MDSSIDHLYNIDWVAKLKLGQHLIRISNGDVYKITGFVYEAKPFACVLMSLEDNSNKYINIKDLAENYSPLDSELGKILYE